MKKKLVVLTGAGMSAESGIATFRDSGGLWEQYPVEKVATPEGFAANPELVQEFYNKRRRELLNAKPNEGHHRLAEMENDFDVHIITQNIDNLHEQAGSTNVLHLHGELMKSRSTGDPSLVYEMKASNLDIRMGDTCEKGFLPNHTIWGLSWNPFSHVSPIRMSGFDAFISYTRDGSPVERDFISSPCRCNTFVLPACSCRLSIFWVMISTSNSFSIPASA